MEEVDSLLANDVSIGNYVLGRKDDRLDGVLTIGRYYAMDHSLGALVHLDVLHPHVILICGKRGYGKSYSLGVLMEEVVACYEKCSLDVGMLVIDTLGIYWTSRYPNTRESEQLLAWGEQPKGLDIHVLVPQGFVNEYYSKGIMVGKYTIRVSDLSAFHWCQLFDVKPTDPLGVVLTQAVLHLQQQVPLYSIHDLINCILNDTSIDVYTKKAAENYFMMAESWGVFDVVGTPVSDVVQQGRVNVLDLSCLPHPFLKGIVVSVIGQQLFHARVRERKVYEENNIGLSSSAAKIPLVWCLIDESQVFLPADKECMSKTVLLSEWIRQGRQPGLSLVLATQRPSSLDPEVLSHCDILICHRLTAQQDLDMLSKIRPVYLHVDISECIKKVGDEKGVALIFDDVSESMHVIKIRPRRSWHGGNEPNALRTINNITTA